MLHPLFDGLVRSQISWQIEPSVESRRRFMPLLSFDLERTAMTRDLCAFCFSLRHRFDF
ncbi:hypothetical protein RBSH_03754 [Rhodopirellula baltica SH28]|uniref:Uncharacterized protein n=1 Tax=Rhodopirellula baltica SH28 TaxID=993517 RepID=K5DEP1_RHOBT|nr:hypothetical protein RBSH_03754 [Rhodopirellula baltica SH28]